jgi:hypothetical protein
MKIKSNADDWILWEQNEWISLDLNYSGQIILKQRKSVNFLLPFFYFEEYIYFDLFICYYGKRKFD